MTLFELFSSIIKNPYPMELSIFICTLYVFYLLIYENIFNRDDDLKERNNLLAKVIILLSWVTWNRGPFLYDSFFSYITLCLIILIHIYSNIKMQRHLKRVRYDFVFLLMYFSVGLDVWASLILFVGVSVSISTLVIPHIYQAKGGSSVDIK